MSALLILHNSYTLHAGIFRVRKKGTQIPIQPEYGHNNNKNNNDADLCVCLDQNSIKG